jgi:two-component system, LytTR family, response regulator
LLNVVIVEDEKPILELMKVIIGRNPNYTITGAFTSPLEALSRLPELRADVAFLDVEMPKMNGLELAQKINELSQQTQIVFTTAYKEYALDAFGVRALDYILKPVTPAAIERVTERLAGRKSITTLDGKYKGASPIRCFGSFELRSSAGELVSFRTRKTEELLAYFLCHSNRVIDKWKLLDLLWSDSGEKQASHNLYQSIYQVKKMLKDNVVDMEFRNTNKGYMLDTRNENLDVLDYQQLDLTYVEQLMDYEEVERLCSLYRGPLLDGKPYLWKVPLEESFQKHFTTLTRKLIDRDLAKENWSGAEQRLDAYLSIYPLHEEMNRMLIDIYANRGAKEKVARHYKRFEAAYRAELGLEPPRRLSELVASYLR